MKKIVMIAPQSTDLVIFRIDLIKDILKKNYEVVAIVPDNTQEEYFNKLGIQSKIVELEKNSISPLKSLKYQEQVKKVLLDEKPEKVFLYTSKPVIFGSLAAKKAGIKEIYSLVCGLGSVYATDTLKNKLLRIIMGHLYKKAFKYNSKVIFQNSDDIDLFVKKKYLLKEKSELVNGSGVNLNVFKRNKLPDDDSFIMVSRVINEKGYKEYFNAAKIVKEKYPNAKFTYIGQYDNSYKKDFEKMQPLIKKNIVKYIPFTNDVASYIAKSKVCVLPSYYREGIPKTLLEATAMGRPIITTNTPGCRETVKEYKNGLFVNIKDESDLAKKMIWMIENKDKLSSMSDESYNICLQKFTIEKINKRMLQIMKI